MSKKPRHYRYERYTQFDPLYSSNLTVFDISSYTERLFSIEYVLSSSTPARLTCGCTQAPQSRAISNLIARQAVNEDQDESDDADGSNDPNDSAILKQQGNKV
jgi:hypothetical protein